MKHAPTPNGGTEPRANSSALMIRAKRQPFHFVDEDMNLLFVEGYYEATPSALEVNL
jgi:hypothetical protein